jgi:hypothetical protein
LNQISYGKNQTFIKALRFRCAPAFGRMEMAYFLYIFSKVPLRFTLG